jgi:hypothetical protein
MKSNKEGNQRSRRGVNRYPIAAAVLAILMFPPCPAPIRAGEITASTGVFRGHEWRIDENHLLWWDAQPYVRYGFTGNGPIDKFMELGFSQFNVYPSEKLWVVSHDPADHQKAIRDVDEFTDELVRRKATYYAGLNSLWQWPGSDKIQQEEMVKSVFKRSWSISEHAGQTTTIELEATSRMEVEFTKEQTRVHLFDVDKGSQWDVSDRLERIAVRQEQIRESESESATVKKCVFHFGEMDLPRSRDLRMAIFVDVDTAVVPHVYPSSFPALWKPGIIQYYTDGLESFSSAYAKDGLRGMLFGDEINTDRVSFAGAGLYIDFREDAIALKAYRTWLRKRFGAISQLNRYLGTDYRSFDETTWHLCRYPFLEEEIEREDPWTAVHHTFSSLATGDQCRKVGELQEEFRVAFFGDWLARYGAMAKKIIGDVPVFITSAGIGGPADGYLQIHRHALLAGLDGLVRNHYGNVKRGPSGQLATYSVWSEARFPLETVTGLLASVQKESGVTKSYFANEFGCPKPGGYDDFGLGNQFSFSSKEKLRDFLHVLIMNGCKGFNMFKMDPDVPAAKKEVKWLAEMKDDIIRQTIATTDYSEDASISKERAIQIALQHSGTQSVQDRYSDLRTSASFNRRYDVWIVELLAGGREIGFVSISMDGKVVEIDVKE